MSCYCFIDILGENWSQIGLYWHVHSPFFGWCKLQIHCFFCPDETFPDLSGNPDFCSAEKSSGFSVGGSKALFSHSHACHWLKKVRDFFWKFWVSSLLLLEHTRVYEDLNGKIRIWCRGWGVNVMTVPLFFECDGYECSLFFRSPAQIWHLWLIREWRIHAFN